MTALRAAWDAATLDERRERAAKKPGSTPG